MTPEGKDPESDDGTTVPGIAGDDELTYFTFVHDPDPSDNKFEMILLYLVRDSQTRQVEVIEDRHRCGLFPIEGWLAMMAEAGLEAEALAEQSDGGEGTDAEPGAWSVLLRALTPVQ